MKHDVFKFTIKFIKTSSCDELKIKRYLRYCCHKLPQPSGVNLKSVYAYKLNNTTYIAYVDLLVKNYAVPEIGVDIVISWIKNIFIFYQRSTFYAKTIIIHPKVNSFAQGALIEWDSVKNKPIVKTILKKNPNDQE